MEWGLVVLKKSSPPGICKITYIRQNVFLVISSQKYWDIKVGELILKMGRIKGATDLKKRKVRKDKGKKKKKIVNFKKFKKRIGRKTHIKLYIWDITEMSRDGFHHWNKNIRLRVRRVVYGRTRWRIDAPVDEIASKELIEDFMLRYIGIEGNFLVMGLSGSLRSKRGVKWVKMFSVSITEHTTGLRCELKNNYRLFRYWFWRQK